MGQAETRTYAFGPFLLVPAERLLLRDGNPVRLTPKAFALLILLAENAGSALGKDEIIEALWPGRFVIEANLTKHIWMLRRALGDDDERYIETVPKLGYRFAGVVETIPSAANGPRRAWNSVTPQKKKASAVAANWMRSRRPAMLVAGLLAGVLGVILVALMLYRSPSSRDSPPQGATVALTDPTDLSPERETSWIGPAVQEMVGTSLSLGRRLR